jgi:uncharacterized Zn finger protein
MPRYDRHDRYYGWRPYVPVAERRRRAARKVASLKKAGRDIAPVEIDGRKIARTFWGDAWCKNLEAYGDFANRLPRGRTYVRNGSVVDLQIAPGKVTALVSGSDFYEIEIGIEPLPAPRWLAITSQCAGQIDSLVELLAGTISGRVMEVVSKPGDGMFPAPREIALRCTCPDWATMCKHVAAALYGVGARLDHRPELLFALRKVDPAELVEVALAQSTARRKPRSARVLQGDQLSAVFGIDLETDAPEPAAEERERQMPARKPRSRKPAARKPAAKKAAARKPAAKKPAAKNPAARNPATRKPATRKPVAKKSAAKKLAIRKPGARKPTAK